MANRIALVLAQKRIRQDVLAKALEITPATISRWCSNTSQPSNEKLFLLAAYLNVDISELVYGTIKTVSFEKSVDLKILNAHDAFLHMVYGSTDLLNLQKAMFVVRSDYPDDSMKSYPITLFGYMNLEQPTHISMIEVGEIIEDCEYTKLTVENCTEKITLTFHCPSPATLIA